MHQKGRRRWDSVIWQQMSGLSNTGMETVGRPPSRGHSASCRLGSFNAGKFTGARIPFVYTVVDGYLAKHPQNASTVRGIFTNVAAGSTLMAECRRLTEATGRRWREGTLSAMLHNRLYLGEHVYHAEQKAVMRDVVPVLTTLETWTKAQTTLKANVSRRTSQHQVNILCGLLKCAFCGATFICTPMRPGAAYYRCGNALSVSEPDPAKRCKAIFLRAEWIEEAAWEMCKAGVEKFPTWNGWQQIFNEELVEWGEMTSRESLEAALAEVDAGRERLLAMVRKNQLTPDEAAKQVDAGRKEAAGIRRHLDDLAHREESPQKMLELLEREVAHLDEIKSQMVDADAVTRHDIVKRLLTSATFETHGSGRRKIGVVTFHWWYAVESVEVVGSDKAKKANTISTTSPYESTVSASIVDA